MTRTLRRTAAGAALVVTILATSPAQALASPSAAPPEAVTEDVAGESVALERLTVPIERQTVPFDGRTEVVEGQQVSVSLDADVLFEFDKADLTAQAQQTLTGLAEELDEFAEGPVTIVGHTDARGDDPYNLDLSLRRAQAVQGFLAGQVTAPVTFEVDGRGEVEPVAPNENPDGSDDPEGRRRNRRVEITYTSTEEPAEPPASE